MTLPDEQEPEDTEESEEHTQAADDIPPPPPVSSVTSHISTKEVEATANNKRIMMQFATQMKSLSGKEILSNIPSLKDTNYLFSIIPKKSESVKHKDGIK